MALALTLLTIATALAIHAHAFGHDEFGRDHLAAILAAALFSVLKGGSLAMFTFVGALALGGVLAFGKSPIADTTVRATAAVIEAIPGMLWILVIASVAKFGTMIIVALAFLLVSLPGITRLVAAEITRLKRRDYVKAAEAIGCSPGRILLTHVLPNSVGLLWPAFVQLLGNAIAIGGVIGLLGLGSRADLDLGVFLFRGKEQVALNPTLFLASLACYIVLYALLARFSSMLDSDRERRQMSGVAPNINGE